MGLFDWLGGGGGGKAGGKGGGKKDQKTIDRAAAKVKNPHVQPDDRQRNMEALYRIGSPDAIDALLGRFTMRLPGAIIDEDEKRMVFDWLKELGEPCVEPLKAFIHKETAIYWPSRALAAIAGEAAVVETLLAALDASEQGYNTETERREQLTSNLREYTGVPAALERLLALCTDESTEVRILALDGICEFDDPRIRPSLIARLADEAESPRVKATVVDLLASRRIPVGDDAELVQANLSDLFQIDADGRVVRN